MGQSVVMTNQAEHPVLTVENLDIEYQIGMQWRNAIHNFELTVYPQQIVGIVGESGSGKSTVIKAIMRYLSNNGRISQGRIHFKDQDLVQTSRRQMRSLWGGAMHMVPQNAFAAMNPSLRIGEQIAEVIRIHDNLSASEVNARVHEILGAVRLADPAKIAKRYPHEISGGQQQRAVLAMAFATAPDLLLLDEPTTSLDVTTEATILDLIDELIDRTGAGAIYVTHNLGVVAQVCERVTVMYGGEIMEDAPVEDLYANPLHPYTIGLLASIPKFGQTKYQQALQMMPGSPPSLGNRPTGCVFAERCPIAVDHCFTTKPSLEYTDDQHKVRCHRWPEIADGTAQVRHQFERGIELKTKDERADLLEVQHMTKHFEVRLEASDLLKKLQGKDVFNKVRAVDDVNIRIQHGKTLGLVGESGSGKTTLSRMIVGLTERTSGEMTLLGADVKNKVGQRTRDTLRQLQMVFQNPQDSLNPYLRVGQSIQRPLIKLAKMKRGEAQQRVKELLEAVNLDETYMGRYPSELSGGEKQRVAIARAFASNPEIIVCDEPVSALDVSVQAAVLNLLARLQDEHDTAYLFISHDLAVVGYLADYVAVMYLGEIFEASSVDTLFQAPYHPYTEALISSIPIPDPTHQTQHIRLSSDVPSPRNLPSGCRFHTRCPRKIGDICEQEVPPWREAEHGHFIRCHIPIDELITLQESAPETVEE